MKVNKLYYLLFIAPVAVADTNGDSLKFDASVTTQFTDNAKKQSLDSGKVDERQDIYQVGAAGNYNNEWVAAKAAYSLSRQQFIEESQPNYTSLVGDLALDLGASYQPAHLRILHSSESLLNSPDAIDISTNRDERSILTVQPSFRWRVSDADRLEVSARKTDVSYDKTKEKDSNVNSAQLSWMREISKVDSLSLTATSSKTSFDVDPLLDYKLESLLVGYSAALKHLQYSISVGANRVIQTAEDVESTRPNFDASFKYSDGYSSWSLNAGRRISDSSMGTGRWSGDEPSGGASTIGVGIDVIDLTSVAIAWSTNVICERCVLDLSLERSKEDYEVLLEDSTTRTIGASFSYRVDRRGVITFSFSDQKRDFESTSLRNELSNKSYEIKYNYSFANNISLGAFGKKYQRDSINKFSAYDENIVGIQLAYSF